MTKRGRKRGLKNIGILFPDLTNILKNSSKISGFQKVRKADSLLIEIFLLVKNMKQEVWGGGGGYAFQN